MTIKKRGRPIGSKNKVMFPPLLLKNKPTMAEIRQKIDSLSVKEKDNLLLVKDKIDLQFAEKRVVDFKELCQKLQNALSLAYVEIDFLRQKTQLDRQAIIIEYLESRVK